MERRRIMLQKLKKLKDDSHMTCQQVADASGIPLSTVNRILSGQTLNPSFITIASMIRAMGGSLDDFFDGESVPDSLPESADCNDDIIEMYREMLSQKDAVIADKNRWIKFLLISVLVLAGIFVCIALFDVFDPNFGYVRY